MQRVPTQVPKVRPLEARPALQVRFVSIVAVACILGLTSNARLKGHWIYPMVVMKLDVKLSSEKRSNKQLFPTPARTATSCFRVEVRAAAALSAWKLGLPYRYHL